MVCCYYYCCCSPCRYGSWGVCFTYGTWFGIEGLVCAGQDSRSPPVTRATQFLLARQNPNGGWGESYVACVDKAYPRDGSGDVSSKLLSGACVCL